MDSTTILRRRLMQAASGEWNPGFEVDAHTVMHCLCGNTDFLYGTASVLTPILPVYEGDENVTYYIANKTPDGAGVADIKLTTSNNQTKLPSYHLYKDAVFGSFYQMNVSGNAFNRVLTRGTGKSVDSAYNGLKFCVWLFGAEESYAYIAETGRVLFAGKNTPYYGKSNIND